MENEVRKRAAEIGDKGEFEFYAAMKPYGVYAEYNHILKGAGLKGLGFDVEKLICKVARKNTTRQMKDRVDADVTGTWASVAAVKQITHPDLGDLTVIEWEELEKIGPHGIDVKTQEPCYLPRNGRNTGTGNLYMEDALFAEWDKAEYWVHVMPHDDNYDNVDVLLMPRVSEATVKGKAVTHLKEVPNKRDAGYVLPLREALKIDGAKLIQKRRGVVGGKDGYTYSIDARGGRYGVFGIKLPAYFVEVAEHEKWREEWKKAAA